MSPQAAHPEAPWPRPAYAWYVVVVLLLAYILAFVDREVMALLVKPIKAQLAISDTGVSLLLGLAFALFYTGFAIPIAWVADHFSRRWVVVAGVSLWSIATAACGFATSFPWLFTARVGVGVGEAALNPSALSLLRDYFPPARMGLAIGLYTAGVSSGSGIANIIGGAVYPRLAAAGARSFPLLGTLQPWQQMFVMVGLPGIAVALLLLTIREPLRRGITAAQQGERAPLFGAVLFVLARWRTYLVLYVAMSVLGILAYGVGFWTPEFLRRTYALDNATYGHYVQIRGLILVFAGLAGVLSGGWLCDRFRMRYADAYIRVCLIGFLFLAIGYCSFALMPTPQLALLMLVPASFGAGVPTAAGIAAVVAIAPPKMRAQLVALFYFVLNLIGLSVGPTVVALVTDFYFHDEAQLRYSLTVVSTAALGVGFALLFFCLRHYRASVVEARAWS